MLKTEDIVDGTLVYNQETKEYGYITDVGNSREKGDRGSSTVKDDELSYSVVNILTNEKFEGICEHSHMTSEEFSVATIGDVDVFLAILEADAMINLGKAKKTSAKVAESIANFTKLKRDFNIKT